MNQYSDDTFLARWLNQSLTPEELEAFQKTEDYANLTRVLKASQILKNHPFDKEKNMQSIKQKLAKEQKTRKLYTNMRRWAVAATILLLVTIGFWWWQLRDIPRASPLAFQTGIGEQLTHEFADGTTITLNAASEMKAEIFSTSEKRNIFLKGEAFLKVSRGESFEVQTDNGTVSVLGTEFSVLSRDSLFWVSCFEGSVEVRSNGQKEILKAGDGLEMTIRGKLTEKISQSIKSDLTWLQGVTNLQNVTGWEAVAELERQYGIKLKFSNVRLDESSNFTFPHQNLEEALYHLSEVYGLSIQKTDSLTYQLRRE